MRTFALADESALLICSWPHSDRPKAPFPYFSEVMTGFEYQAAARMIYEGLVEEGLTVMDAIRARFDGYRRSPWNEQECGHHYARAMASWAALLALSSFHYSAVSGQLQLAPHWKAEAFRCVRVIPSGWGVVTQTLEAEEQTVRSDSCSALPFPRRLPTPLSAAAFGPPARRRGRRPTGPRRPPAGPYLPRLAVVQPPWPEDDVLDGPHRPQAEESADGQ